MLIASVLLVALYVGAAIWRKRKLPESISALVYDLSKPWQRVWSLWLALVTLFLSPSLTYVMPNVWASLLADAMIVCLAMTAAMPLLPGYHNRAHYVCSIAAGVISQVLVWIVVPYWLWMWVVLPVLPFIDKKWFVPGVPMWLINAKVLILEAVCSFTLFGALFTKLIMIMK